MRSAAFGHPAARTPNLDRLAADGLLFSRHYTSAAPCGPARATLLTGLYPFIHRSIVNGAPLDRRHTNLALEVRKAGRDPVLIGSTDSSADPRDMAPEDPRLRSFEGILPGFTIGAALNESCLEEWLTGLAKRGHVIPERHMDIYRHAATPDVMERFSRAPARYAADESDTAFVADRVLDYIRLRRDRDWFLHVVFLRPHPPIIAPAPYNTMIDAADVPAPRRHASRAAEAAQHPFLAGWLEMQKDPAYFESQVSVQEMPEEDRAAMRAVYFGLIAEVDAQIGRIVDHLKSTGEYEETLIVFTSDHGEMLGDHWAWGKGGWFDASNHIPLIVRDPFAEGPKGRRVDAFTESVDLAPTILSWLALGIPDEWNGASLLPWLDGKTAALWRRGVFWEFDFRMPVTEMAETAFGISSDECTLDVYRDTAFKYVHFTSLPPLLYDLRADPDELVNLAERPEYATVVAAYARKLLSLRMLHAERTLANTVLTPRGVLSRHRPRGKPPDLFAFPG